MRTDEEVAGGPLHDLQPAVSFHPTGRWDVVSDSKRYEADVAWTCTKVSQVGIVKLDVGAASFGESSNLSPVYRRKVLKELLNVGVRGDVDSCPSASEVNHGRRRNGNLDDTLVTGQARLDEFVVLDLDGRCVLELAGHSELRSCRHATM